MTHRHPLCSCGDLNGLKIRISTISDHGLGHAEYVAPLQAAEVVGIRNRIQNFDQHVTFFRDVFRNYDFFRYECEHPYGLADRINGDILRLENEMKDIQGSGSLFEVNVPEFKPLRQCRKELRMLKHLSSLPKEITDPLVVGWDISVNTRPSIKATDGWSKGDNSRAEPIRLMLC
uniref:Uncharacterized protein n=1 Tax=Lutzomyia longipalpis TaxID=7200 RepID=A0A1B0CQ40_LUTLO